METIHEEFLKTKKKLNENFDDLSLYIKEWEEIFSGIPIILYITVQLGPYHYARFGWNGKRIVSNYEVIEERPLLEMKLEVRKLLYPHIPELQKELLRAMKEDLARFEIKN